jgi:hypothetical protein
MAKSDPGYKPLPLADRWRLNRAIQSLRSPFHSVRLAAHKEIQKILARRSGGRPAVPARKRATAMWRRVRYGRPMECHGCDHPPFHDRRMFAAHALEHNRAAREAVAPQHARAGALRGREPQRSEHERARDHSADFIAAGRAPAPRQPGAVLRGRDLRQRARDARAGREGTPVPERARAATAPAGPGHSTELPGGPEYERKPDGTRPSRPAGRTAARAATRAQVPADAPAMTAAPGKTRVLLPSEITRPPRAPRQSRIRLPRLNRAH